MYARIIEGVVATKTEEMPMLAPGECALIVECGSDVETGWAWTPEGIVAPVVEAPDPNAAIDAQIAALEATQTLRRVRDAMLTDEGKAWLAELEARIAVLRAQRTPTEAA